MAFAGQTPTIVVLREGGFRPHFRTPLRQCVLRLLTSANPCYFFHYYLGTDASQGKGQILSNINACVAVQSTVKSTLGPYGGDLLLVDSNGKQTITNDGATVMKVRLLLVGIRHREKFADGLFAV
jgi:hypothetical protein